MQIISKGLSLKNRKCQGGNIVKVLYVSDNRCRGNLGCRATSIALSQLIEKNNEIVGRISGAYTNWNCGNLVVNNNWSSSKYERLSRNKHWSKLAYIYYHFNRFLDGESFFFGKHDFISYNLDESIENLKKCISANPHIAEYNLEQYDFDIMVVNGEGSFIFSEIPWRESLIITMLMHWAQKLGKKVYFLNAMLSDDPNSKHNGKMIDVVSKVFEKCEVVQVRENDSYNYMKKYFGSVAKLEVRPDALFSWYNLINDKFEVVNGAYHLPYKYETDESFYKYDFTKPYILICASSSSLIMKDIPLAIEKYTKLVENCKKTYEGFGLYLVVTDWGDNFLKKVSEKTGVAFIPTEMNIVSIGKIIANARLFITGRYHPAILASLGGTPCVFMGSNSHKTISLQKLLQYENPKEYSCLPSDDEIEQIIYDGKKNLDKGENLREKIKKRVTELSEKAISIQYLIKE